MAQDVVLGAGISGLALAFELVERGRDVVLLEASSRVGGTIATRQVDGLIVEQGPQSLQATPDVLSLLGRLGLRDEIVAAHPQTSSRYVLHHGRLVALPHGPADLFSSPLLSTREALRLLSEPLQPSGGPADETVHNFVARRFGPAVADRLADPFVAGVFGGDPRSLEVASAFADLPRFEREHGSVVRGALHAARTARRAPWAPRSMFTLAGGLGRLVEALAVRLGARVRLRQRALEVREQPGGWEVRTPREVFRGQRLWVCLPYAATRGLFAHLDLAVPTAPVAAVHLFYPREAVRHPLRGFGWLAPSHERTDVLGCLWVSSIFPGHAPGMAALRVMIGGMRAPHRATLPEDVLVARARELLAEVQGIEAEPVFTDVSVAREGIPQYAPGHAAAVVALQRRSPTLRFSSWAFTGVGVSHCVRNAARLAAELGSGS